MPKHEAMQLMAEIFILIPIEPVPKGRPRVDTRGKFPRMHTPQRTIDFERLVAAEARKTMASAVALSGPLQIVLDMYLPIRPSWTRKRQEMARQGLERPISGGLDWDNLAKSVCDAFNGIVWQDDSQIVDGRCRKFYADEPRIVARVRTLDLGLPHMHD